MQKTKNIVIDISDIKYVENALDEADKQAKNPNTKYLTHDEVFNNLRRKLNGWNL